MAVTVVASASKTNTDLTDQTSVVCNKPTGTASGDFMVAVFTAPYTGSLTYTLPSGWTLASSTNGGGGVSLWSGLAYKAAGGSEPSTYTFQCSAAGSLNVGIITYRGTDGTFTGTSIANPRSSTGTTSNPASGTALATLAGPGLASLAISWHDSGSSHNTVTATSTRGVTELWDVEATDGTPSTHDRGSAAYVENSAYSSGDNTPAMSSFTLSGAPTSYVVWAWGLADSPSGSMAATLPSLTGSFLGSRTVRITDGTPHLPSLSASFEAKRHGVLVELLIGAAWTDVTEFVRYDSAVSLTTGRTTEGTSMTTSIANFTLDNRPETTQNRFSLRNASGPYYGLIGRNTRVRLQDLEFGYRFHGEVSSWAPGADSTNSDQYVELECSGIVRRLDASNSSIQPAIQREILANSPLAYWPCDELSGSFASPIAGVRNMQVLGSPTYQGYSDSTYGLACSSPLPQVNDSTWYTPTIAGVDLTNGVTVAFLLASPGGITNGTELAQFSFDLNDSIYGPLKLIFNLSYTGTNELTLSGPNFSGLPTITGTVPIVGKNGVLVYVGTKCTAGGSGSLGLWYQGEVDAAPVLVDVDTWGFNAGTVGSQFSLSVNPYRAALSDASSAYMGQIAVWDGYGPDNTLEYTSVGAYSGEAAGTRFARLCTEEGITHTVNNASNSSAMGPQLPNGVMNLLRECEATDMGIMYELRNDFGLGYVVRRDLYNQSVALELDYSAGDLSSQLQPTFDDKDTKNDVTVQRVGGSQARYVIDSDSALSTQNPPNGVGLYATSVSVSLGADDQCYKQAGWRAHLGTVDEERVTSLGLAMENRRFVNDSTLRGNAMSVVPGSRIMVTNCPDWTSDVDQIVQGYTERFDQFTHDITYNTSSAKPYNTAVVETSPTTTTAKADSLTSTLGADIDDDDASLSVAVTGVLWSTTADDFDIIVGGERMTVTAVSGSSSPQTFTVTRSVNGVTKAHTTGEQVRLYKPAIVGL